jgi:hypothetical protein
MAFIAKINDVSGGDITSIVSSTGLSGGATSGEVTLTVDAAQGQITTVGTIGSGAWQGTAIASAYIAGDAITGAKIADDAIDSEHYTDGSIDEAHIGDNQVTLAKMAGIVRGKILYGDASGNPAALTVGSNTYVLTSDGTDVAWAAPVGGNSHDGDVTIANGYGLVVGNGSQETVSIGDGATDLVPELQVLGTASADSSILLAAFSTTATTAGGPILAFAKGGNATLGSHTIVTDGEELGNIIAFGDDGADLETPAASIQFEVDGTPGTADMPGRILFNTTADGATALTERMRIDSAGQVNVAATTASTSVSTGALVVDGGLGVALDIVGGDDLLLTSSAAAITFNADVSLTHSANHLAMSGGDFSVTSGNKIFFDNGSDTYIYQESFDDLHIVVGGVAMLELDQDDLEVKINNADLVLGDAVNVSLATPLLAGADHTTTGLTAEMLAGGAISAFDVVCIHTTTQEVVEADASALATTRVIGIAPAAISDTATGTILLHGFIRDDSWNWTTGATLYLSETAGAMTETAPTTSGAFVKVVGIALEPDVVYINPDNSWIELA